MKSFVGPPNALVQLQAHYHHFGEAASESACLLQRSLGSARMTNALRCKQQGNTKPKQTVHHQRRPPWNELGRGARKREGDWKNWERQHPFSQLQKVIRRKRWTCFGKSHVCSEAPQHDVSARCEVGQEEQASETSHPTRHCVSSGLPDALIQQQARYNLAAKPHPKVLVSCNVR